MKKSYAILLTGTLFLAGCDKITPSSPEQAPPSAASAPVAAIPGRPQTQVDFIAFSANLKTAQTSAASDAERDRLRKEAPATFCARFNTLTGFDGWVGTVDDIRTSTVNKSIDFTLDIGDHIKLEEVLQTTDKLYPAVAALQVGDTVRLSGAFVHTPSGSECTYYMGPFAVEMSSLGTT